MTTLLDLFDDAVEKLIERGTAAKAPSGICMYRNDKGEACLVGLMINDNEYDDEMESNTVIDNSFVIQGILRSHPDLPYLTLAQLSWLTDCQYIHDHHDPSNWKEDFALIRKEYPGDDQ